MKKHAVERRVIQISFLGGKSRDVDAHVIGALAVHRDCDVDKSLGVNWCVTHVRTGCSVIGANARATFRQAMKIMRECHEADWDFGEFGKAWTTSTAPRVVQTIRLSIRAAGIQAGLTLREDKKPIAKRVKKPVARRVK